MGLKIFKVSSKLEVTFISNKKADMGDREIAWR